MAFSVPSLKRICVIKVVKEIKDFCQGVRFEDLGKFKFIVGPFENLSSQSIEAIFEYVISTQQLSLPWLSLLIVTHLRTLNFKKFPSGVNLQLFKMILNRCQLLERLIIPNCKKIPSSSLCAILKQNPSLLELDISNKVSPKVDVVVVDTLVRSCRYLTVLKLSDYRVEDPKTLLLLCGKRVIEEPTRGRMSSTQGREAYSISPQADTVQYGGSVVPNASCYPEAYPPCKKQKANSVQTLEDRLSSLHVLSSPSKTFSDVVCVQRLESADASSNQANQSTSGACESMVIDETVSESVPSLPQSEMIPNNEREVEISEEEQENERGGNRQLARESVNPDNSDEDLYEDDSPMTALNVEDHSMEYGCLDLKTLWLDNVNITDPVAAVLMQSLPRLRDLNLSDTDICNPWRLLDTSCTAHLIELEDLDIKSTALSRTALEMIPKFHPDLHRFCISSTTLPPHTYANIGRLTGVADLELIGGQFYPCEPKEIFDKGIAPAIIGIGKHLKSLNLTYFAHVKFEVIPKNCPKLEHLDLSYTSTSLWYPCESLGDCCPNLKTLNLDFCHIDAKEGSEIDPQPVELSKALEKMIGQPQNLEVLKLSGSAVSDNTLQHIFPKVVHHLRVLDLSRCSAATIRGVEYVWEKCPFIRKIDLTYCKEITVDNLNHFQERCFKERPLFKLEGKLVWK